MATDAPDRHPEEDEERKEKRRGALALLRSIRDDVQRVCSELEQIERTADSISRIIDHTRSLAEQTGADDLLPVDMRRELSEAADRFERWRRGTEQATGLCERIQRVLDSAETVLGRGLDKSSPEQRPDSSSSRGGFRGGVLAAVVAVVAVVAVTALWPRDDDDDSPAPSPTSVVGGSSVPAASPTVGAKADLALLLAAGSANAQVDLDGTNTGCTVGFTVRNIGRGASGPSVARVKMGPNGTFSADQNVPALSGGASQNFKVFVSGARFCLFDPDSSGSITVDVTNTEDELDETNNEAGWLRLG